MRKTAHNRRLAKKRVQCLNEVLCFVSSSVLADNFVLRNPLLRQAPKRYVLFQKTDRPMDRLTYFINKLWNFVTTIHPLTYLTLFIVSGLLFFLTKWTIQKFRPQRSNQNAVAATLTIFVGLPVLGLILLFIVGQLLKDQPF